MAIYKDYGTPPSTNSTNRTAGLIGAEGQDVILGGGNVGQFQGGSGGVSAPLEAASIRDKEAPMTFTIASGATMYLGSLAGALAVAVKDGETELRLQITSTDGTTDVIEVDWNGTDVTINGSATGSVLEVADTATLASNIAVSDDTDGNLRLVAGASAGASLIVRRVTWS
jgi:hypothetical protein